MFWFPPVKIRPLEKGRCGWWANRRSGGGYSRFSSLKAGEWCLLPSPPSRGRHGASSRGAAREENWCEAASAGGCCSCAERGRLTPARGTDACGLVRAFWATLFSVPFLSPFFKLGLCLVFLEWKCSLCWWVVIRLQSCTWDTVSTFTKNPCFQVCTNWIQANACSRSCLNECCFAVDSLPIIFVKIFDKDYDSLIICF